MTQRILITGANGFIGQHLVNLLSQRGWLVTAMVRKGSVPGFDLNKNVKVVVADLLDKKSLERVLSKGMTVINLAVNGYDPILSYKVNVGGLRDLIDVCRKKGVTRLIQFSSQSIKIEKKGVYAKTKILADDLLRKSNLSYVIVRPSLVYGEGQKGLFNKIRGLVAMSPVIPIFGNGLADVYPVYVGDLAVIVERILKNKKDVSGEYDVGSVSPVSYKVFYEKVIKKLGRKPRLLHIPVMLGIMVGRFFEKMGMKNPPFFVDNVLGSTQKTSCNVGPVVAKYGLKPLSFNQGLKEVFDKSRLRVAVVGLGKMGMLHLSILKSMEDVLIVAVVDKNEKSFGTISSMGIKAKAYTSLDDAMRREKIEAVFILTPTFTHLSLMEKAIKRGISVFVEKPMALNKEQIDKVKKIKIKKDVVVAVGYTLLYGRIFRELNRLIKQKSFGEVKSFRASYEHAEVFGVKKGWMFEKKKAGGGALMNPGPHLFSLLYLFFGKPKKIDGQIEKLYSVEVEDVVRMVWNYGDYNGKVLVNWSAKGKLRPRIEIEIEFERARVMVDGKEIRIFEGRKTVKLIRREEIEPIYKEVFNINPEAYGEAYYSEDRAFIEAVLARNGKNLINGLGLALKVEAMIMECYKNCEITA